MAATGLIYHPAYLEHDTGDSHPESPERLRFVYQALKRSGALDRLDQLTVPDHPRTDLLQWIGEVHAPSHINQIKTEHPSDRLHYLDGDTPLSARSYAVAALAVEGLLTAVDKVMAQRISSAFCAVRPPGHHAESNRAMGFCLFNNVAVAARYIQKKYHLKNVMVIDWDVHHGNGTQEIFYEDPTVFYFSVHQSPLYPGTGYEEERGNGKGEGFTLNCPLPPGRGDLEYGTVFEKILRPALDAFHPDFILISAGFDAHQQDPLAGMRVTDEGFGELTRLISRWSNRYCGGRIVSSLEGGYHLEALARSIDRHINSLLEKHETA